MTSSTGRPSNPPLALMSSRQMSSAVLITLLGEAPAPVSARLMPILIGLPDCACAPVSSNDPKINVAVQRCSIFHSDFVIVSSLGGGCCSPPSSFELFAHVLGRPRAPIVR